MKGQGWKTKGRTPTIKMVTAKNIIPDDRFCSTPDEKLVDLIARVMAGETPSRVETVRLDSLEAHDTEALRRAGLHMTEEPSLCEAIWQHLVAGLGQWMVSRNGAGTLVVFDNYLPYAIASARGLEQITVQILGEGDEVPA